MDPKADDATTTQPTLVYPPPPRAEEMRPAPSTLPSASRQDGLSPRVEVVVGSGVHLSEETESLLRIRLRAVALTMTCAFGAFLVRDLCLGGHFNDPFLRSFHIVVVAAFLASFVALSNPRPIALQRLRALELFGMTIAFFVTIHYRLVQLRVAEADRVMLMATIKNTVLFVFAMIVLYGMFIPNTWRRAAAVVGSMVAATLLTPLALKIIHPEVFRFIAPLLNFEIVSENFLLRQACGALAEAHAAGLVHRDLKPANIFAARRGHLHDFVKLLDFGLVLPHPDQSAAEPGQDGHIAGSPQYMAPEQATGIGRPDARADLYGLGAVAYYLLTGTAPFTGPSAMAVMIALARDPVEPPSRHRPDLPPDLERVVLRCLSKSPADRYPDADALDRDLASCAAAAEWDFAQAAIWWESRRKYLPSAE